jgi:hypothetical protein
MLSYNLIDDTCFMSKYQFNTFVIILSIKLTDYHGVVSAIFYSLSSGKIFGVVEQS